MCLILWECRRRNGFFPRYGIFPKSGGGRGKYRLPAPGRKPALRKEAPGRRPPGAGPYFVFSFLTAAGLGLAHRWAGAGGPGPKAPKTRQGAWYSHGLPMGVQVEALTRKTQ